MILARVDTFLEPYIRPAVNDLKGHMAAAKGLDGGTGDADKVRGSNDDPAVIAEYEQRWFKRDEHSGGG
jgi:cell filamentation protein